MDQLSDNPNKDKIASVLSVVSSAVPYLGGPVSAILGGYVTKRKFERMEEVINELAEDLKDYQNEASQNFVKTDDFEDLLDDTLRKVACERNDEKRRLFKNMLLKTIKDCDSNYDEHQRILRIIEQLQGDHILLLKAIDQEPSGDSAFSDSARVTLQNRLKGFGTKHLTDLVEQLDDLRVVKLLSSLNLPKRGIEAKDLRGTITPLGRRILNYIEADRQDREETTDTRL